MAQGQWEDVGSTLHDLGIRSSRPDRVSRRNSVKWRVGRTLKRQRGQGRDGRSAKGNTGWGEAWFGKGAALGIAGQVASADGRSRKQSAASWTELTEDPCQFTSPSTTLCKHWERSRKQDKDLPSRVYIPEVWELDRIWATTVRCDVRSPLPEYSVLEAKCVSSLRGQPQAGSLWGPGEGVEGQVCLDSHLKSTSGAS